VKRAALFVRMSDMVCNDIYIQPLLFRPSVAGAGNRLVLSLSGWSNDMSSLANWYREPAG
jgi:peptide/nickel transport system substrate-binding protein